MRGTNRKLTPCDPEAFSHAIRETSERIDETGLRVSIGGLRGGTYGILWSKHNADFIMFTRHMQSSHWE